MRRLLTSANYVQHDVLGPNNILTIRALRARVMGQLSWAIDLPVSHIELDDVQLVEGGGKDDDDSVYEE